MGAFGLLDGFEGVDPVLLVLAAMLLPALGLTLAIVVSADRAMARRIAGDFAEGRSWRYELPAMPRWLKRGER